MPPLTPAQLNILHNNFPHFPTNPHNSAQREFMRLAQFRGWATGSPDFLRNYRNLFGYAWVVGGAQTQMQMQTQTHTQREEDGSLAEAMAGLDVNAGGNDTDTDTDTDSDGNENGAAASSSGSRMNVNPAPRYFDAFPGFTPNPVSPFRTEFNRLADFEGWGRGSKIYWREFTNALSAEFVYFTESYPYELSGRKDILQHLCRDLGFREEEIPESIKKCKEILKSIHVNIFTYVNCKRAGRQFVSPIFTDKRRFDEYTMKKGKGRICPKDCAKANVASRVLMRDIAGLG
ncbi:MAG: hypothetical protein M1831_001168 [Alyxoria varia]|nr:MAG: hypothetical protein M1831_001168 [Alyxoria varia]